MYSYNLRHQRNEKYFKATSTTEKPPETIKLEVDISNLKYIAHGCEIVPYWANYGYCDDISNTENCNFDNGDCCLPNIKTDHCNQCICHEDNLRHPGFTRNLHGSCETSLIYNGFCNDQVNHIKCGFDGSDCCKQNIFCSENSSECICHLDGEKHPLYSKKLPNTTICRKLHF